MAAGNAKLDPRTVPRSRLLDRLGDTRPWVSIVALVGGAADVGIGMLGAIPAENMERRQLVLARCAGVNPALCLAAKLDQASAETLVEFANRAAALAIGHLLVLLPPEALAVAKLQDLLKRFAAEPWLGVVRLGGSGEVASGLITRESLWTALGGLEPSYLDWEWALRDFCLRARAIGYAAPDASAAEPKPGGANDPDAQRFADRAALAPDRNARSVAALAHRSGIFTVYTAITNRYDSLKPQPAVALEGCEQMAFLDRDTAAAYLGGSRGWRVIAADLPEPDPHRASRFYKINAHLALPASAYSLWIDASIGITCPFPLPRLAELFLGESDLCVFSHYARRSVYEEAEACLAYGLDRPDVIEAQMARYRAEGLPATTGLIEAPVLLRRHSEATRALNEAWWTEIVQGSRRDQLSFNYVAWKLGLRYAEFPLSLAMHNGLFVKFMR
jgi:hypothetical protein